MLTYAASGTSLAQVLQQSAGTQGKQHTHTLGGGALSRSEGGGSRPEGGGAMGVALQTLVLDGNSLLSTGTKIHVARY
jgi:hypothetical protein